MNTDKNNNPDLKDRAFELMLEEAVGKYSDQIDFEEAVLTEEEHTDILKRKRSMYKKLEKRIDKASRTKDNIMPARVRKRFILVAAILAVITAGFNVSAVRTFVYKTCVNLSDTKIIFKPEQVEKDNYSKIKNFENKDDIIIPTWLPSEVELVDIDDGEVKLIFQYEKGDLWITIYHKNISDNIIGSGFGAITEGNKYSVSDINVMEADGKLLDITSEIGLHVYSVYWCTDNTQYELSMNGSKIMLDSILESLKYLKDI